MVASAALLVAWTARAELPRVVVPDFELEDAPPFLAGKLSQATARSIDALGCAVARSRDELDAVHVDQLRECYGASGCLAEAGASLGAALIVRGELRRINGGFELSYLVFDVNTKRARKRFSERTAGGLNTLTETVRRTIAPLCESLGLGAEVTADRLASLELELDLDDPPTPEPDVVQELAFEDLPPLLPEPPANPASASPPASAPVAKLEEPPLKPASEPAKPIVVPPRPDKPPAPLAATRPPVTAEKNGASLLRNKHWFAFGASALLALSGGGFGYGALAAADERNATRDRDVYRETQSAVSSRALGANVSFAAAAVAAGIGTWLWLDSGEGP